MRVQLYTDWDEVRTLSGYWNTALGASASDTIFLTWEWTEAWWKNYGAGRELFVLAAWEGGELCGVAPLYVDTSGRWGKVSPRLRLIGDGSNDSDYLDIWARRGRERDTMEAFVEFLGTHQHMWEWLELSGPPSDSPCLAALLSNARARRWQFSQATVPCASLPLPREWDEYLHQLKPRFRTKLRSRLRFFEIELKEAPRECLKQEELHEWLSALFSLHTRRWQSRGEPGVFAGLDKRAFYEDISRATLERGWLAFHRLDWGDRPLALQYGFRYGYRFYLLQEGYDPAFDSLRPGLALRAWLMRHWIEADLKEYDFLEGIAQHKMDWGPREKASVRLHLAPSGLSALAVIRAPRWKARAKETLRSLAPRNATSGSQQVAVRCKIDGSAQSNRRLLRLGQWAVERLYPTTFLGTVGRRIAGRLEVSSVANGRRGLSFHRRRVPILQILMFHRVNDEDDPFFPAVQARAFRRQMEYLARNFPVISLNDFRRTGLPENSYPYYFALTFDDGYRDNYLHAFPILKQLNLPATIFLTTGYLDSGELPWYDQVCLAFKLTTQSRLRLDGLDRGELNLEGASNRLHSLGEVLGRLRTMDEPTRLAVLCNLFRSLRTPGTLTLPSVMLEWEEIRQMKKHGVTFGAHTVTHPVLAKLPSARLVEEIQGSKKVIEENLQVAVNDFAYPFGRPFDIGPEAKRVVQELGFKTAVTTVWGFNRPGDDPLELKRFNPWSSNLGTFAVKLDWFRSVGLWRRTQPLPTAAEG